MPGLVASFSNIYPTNPGIYAGVSDYHQNRALAHNSYYSLFLKSIYKNINNRYN